MTEPTYILGLNAFHGDASACLLRNGEMLAAAEEERFTRVKHWAGFPAQAIAYCLREAGIGLGQVGHVALNQDSAANRWRRLAHLLRHRPDVGLVLARLRHRAARQGVGELLAQIPGGEGFAGQVHAVEHHLAHLASAFYVSPFDEAVVVSVDGFGDFASTAWATARGTGLDLLGRVHFPHSLGIFYQAITQFLGFTHYGDEYKVMGLAPYGEPRFLPQMRRIVHLLPEGRFELDLRFFRHHRERVPMQWEGGSPVVGTLYAPALAELLGPARAAGDALEARHHDLARSAQAMYEEAFFHLLEHLHARSGIERLALAGGCAMNSVANGRLTLRTPFKEVYVQSAAGDAGGAIGAAYAVWHRQGGARTAPHTHAYWGPQFSDEAISECLQRRRLDLEAAGVGCMHLPDEAQLCAQTAQALAAGEVVGWFQGRMEWGPRALGNRSILGDPRRADMKDILNLKIKRRESFRPFAPSVLAEAVPDWFEQEGDVPFMMQVYAIRPERRDSIPAVTHVDGSGRLQSVSAKTNPRYHALISAFAARTGVPMLLNTSFNENEPVVCEPEQAVDCFLRTRMDRLVMGQWVLSRSAAQAPHVPRLS